MEFVTLSLRFKDGYYYDKYRVDGYRDTYRYIYMRTYPVKGLESYSLHTNSFALDNIKIGLLIYY